MKRVLIFKKINDLKPVGGPSGYLYNLKKSLDKINSDIEISFLPASQKEEKKIKKMIPRNLLNLLRAYKYSKILNSKMDLDDKYLDYDFIHFHQTMDLYLCRDFLKKYNGKVILTSHSPVVYHKELLSTISKNSFSFFKKKLIKLEEIDKYSFKRADYIIFPCKEAEEPYFNSWKMYKTIRDENKIKYLTTGIEQVFSKIEKNIYRKNNGFKKEDFIISYVGRHNEIKGYDDLIRLGQRAIKECDTKILCAGKTEPLCGPISKNWKEVGWTNDPHSLINCSDIFVLPNKDTYFDLIVLEVLSLGKILLTTYTGGNKYFAKFKKSGIFYYKDDDDFIEKIKFIQSLSVEERKKLEKLNKDIFVNNFTNDIFANNYLKLLKGLK